jgi:hypothetical protein
MCEVGSLAVQRREVGGLAAQMCKVGGLTAQRPGGATLAAWRPKFVICDVIKTIKRQLMMF